jgi:UDP-glucose 4-epimerase
MIIFIVGGAGYIGSHMAKLATKSNFQVIVLDNLSTGHEDAVSYGKFEFCDILDSKRLNQLFVEYQPDAVMHFGAFSLVEESINDPYKYYHNNVAGTLSLLRAMIDNNCLKFIFSSTAAVYGSPQYIPIDESHPTIPINPYGKSKLMVEQILSDFKAAYGLNYISFRYFNAAGHDREGELSERHEPETHLLPIIMQALNGQRERVVIFGNDYDTKDGTCVRDYIHVEDIASAHLKGLEYLQNENCSSTEFNLGNGTGFSVQEVINITKSLSRKEFKVDIRERRPGDPSTLVASGIKSKKELKVQLELPNLEDIIKTLL